MLARNQKYCVYLQSKRKINYKIMLVMKKQLLLFVLMILPMLASAGVDVDGIYYNLNTETREAEVIYNPDGYTGAVAIPDNVTYNGVEYSVTSIHDSAFEDCKGMTSVSIGNNVTSIGEAAFYGCKNLTSLIIPNSVMFIGHGAFRFCSGLVSLTIGSSVKSLEGGPFMGCTSLTSVKVESGNLKYDSRNDCNAIIETSSNTLFLGIKSTVIPYSITSIGSNAFYGCSELTSITIPSGVTSIGILAFANCADLTSVSIPHSVISIGKDAFANCEGLISMKVESGNQKYDSRDNCNAIIETQTNTLIAGCNNTIIPNSVTSIGEYAFNGCSKLTSVSIPSGLTSIGEGAFMGCGLTSVSIPAGVASIGEGAFSGCSGLTSIKVESGNDNYDSRSNCNAIIETQTNALIAGCKNTVIPNDVTSIGKNGFYGCDELPFIKFSSSVTSIGCNAFYMCRRLTTVTIPNSVTFIGQNAFWGNSLACVVSEIEDPSIMTEYGFSGISYSAVLVVPIGTKSAYQSNRFWSIFKNIIEDGEGGEIGQVVGVDGIRFKIGEDNTVSVTTGNNLCSGAIVIPDQIVFAGKTYTVTSIEDEAFLGCRKLTSVIIPNSVLSIGEKAFAGCGLSSIAIPDNVKTIGINAFGGCRAMKSISIGNGVTSIGEDAFRECTGLTSVTIPNSVLSIGKKAFTDCSSLKSVTIGDGVTTIGDAVFEWSGLTTVNIPNSVTSIGIYAFGNCYLRTVISEIENPYGITSNVFKNSNPKIIVPKGTKAKYQATEGWNQFTNIVEVVDGDANGDEEVNQADVENVESFIIGETPTVFVRSAADMNGDEKIDVVDIVLMQNIIKK